MSEQQHPLGHAEPKPGRPEMPKAYGISGDMSRGMLPWDWVSEQLASARNYWICTTRPDGRPHAIPVWGVWFDETFCFSTDPHSRKGRNLAERPELVVHLESGDDTVVLEGTAERVTDPSLLSRFSDVYHKKYKFRPNPSDPNQGVYALRLQKALAWRESDFTNSATRWLFGG